MRCVYNKLLMKPADMLDKDFNLDDQIHKALEWSYFLMQFIIVNSTETSTL